MLKSLELFGFKSFADRTRFDFAEGITCVVGPNGSGKSNVVDAMKWILGDQSPKSLRGKEMTDVIFNGAAGRKPSGYAEATLTFDNSQGQLPIDTREVQVGRRLWRNGDSEYLINRAPARLKDIRDLFMGTGATTSAYSIIEQGRVDQILQANATARRNVFEEAAGVSRYKSRRTEALRKLERVDQNLLRLTDIVEEVESQLQSTRQQASKAAKYRECSEELRRLWFGLAADDFRLHQASLTATEEEIARIEERIAALSTRQQELEQRVESFDAQIAAVDERLHGLEQQLSTNREAIAGEEATHRHFTGARQELETELKRLRRQRVITAGRNRSIDRELQQTQHRLDECELEVARQSDKLHGYEQTLREQQSQLATVRETTEQERARAARFVQQIADSNNALAALRSKIDAVEHDLEQSASRGSQLERQLEICREEFGARHLTADEAARDYQQTVAAAQNVQARQRGLTEKLETAQRQLAELREQRCAADARKAVLEDLERRHEGMGIGVKEILSRADTSAYPPWNRIIGTVADLLEAELEDAPLLEIALGPRAQLIVLEERGPLVDYLNRAAARVSGRVGFLFLSEISNRADQPAAERPDLATEPGVLMRADRLVSSAPQVPALPAALLAETWIVNTLDDAYRISAQSGVAYRFVTLQGELLERDRTLFVGTVNGDAALVSRKSELRKLKNDLLRLDRQISEGERALARVHAELLDLEAELEEAEAKRLAAHDRLVAARSHLELQQTERERLEQLAREQSQETLRLQQRRNDLFNQLEQRGTEIASAERELQAARDAAEQHEQAAAGIQAGMHEIHQRQNEERLAVAKHEERLAGLRDARERLQHEAAQRTAQAEEAERRFSTLHTRCDKVLLQTLNTTSHLAELALDQQRLVHAVAELQRDKQAIRKQRLQYAGEEAAVRQERRQLKELQHNEEIKARDIRHSIANLEERIEEEYQLPLAEIVATGASALADYLSSAQTRAAAPADDAADAEGLNPELASGDADTPADAASLAALDADAEDTADPDGIDDGREPPAKDAQTPAEVRYEDIRPEIEEEVNRLRRRVKSMGSINTDSLENLDELETRYRHLNDQLQDLVQAKTTLEDIVRRINAESKRLFTESFETIRVHFQELFRKLFGGGEGDAILEDPDDVLECGIDIVARPPGKELRSISLLSGGEKTMTAVALLLAIFKSRPSPFCILDEVDAALDEANIERYSNVIREFQSSTQFIMITHSKRTMTVADVMYGVTMEQSGVSKRMSVRFEDVSEDGEIRTGTDGQNGGAVSTAA